MEVPFACVAGRRTGRSVGDGGEDTDDEALLHVTAQRTLDEIGDTVGEILPTARQTLQRRGFADVEQPRDIAYGAMLAVVQHQYVAVGLGYPSQGIAHEALGLDFGHLIERVGSFKRRRQRFGRSFTFGAQPRLASEIARDATQPCAEPSCLAQLIELAPRREKRVLCNVLAQRAVAGAAIRDRTNNALIALDQRAERFTFATPRGVQELFIASSHVEAVVRHLPLAPGPHTLIIARACPLALERTTPDPHEPIRRELHQPIRGVCDRVDRKLALHELRPAYERGEAAQDIVKIEPRKREIEPRVLRLALVGIVVGRGSEPQLAVDHEPRAAVEKSLGPRRRIASNAATVPTIELGHSSVTRYAVSSQLSPPSRI